MSADSWVPIAPIRSSPINPPGRAAKIVLVTRGDRRVWASLPRRSAETSPHLQACAR